MDPETAFLQAALPQPVSILGQSLRPYSIGHHMLLSRLHSPFLVGGVGKLPIDALSAALFPAVYVCCFRSLDAVEKLCAPDFAHTLYKWRRNLSRKSLLHPFRDKLDINAHAVAFLTYLEAGSQAPDIHRMAVPPGTIKPGSPVILLVLKTLLELGHSIEQALDCPYGMARWIYFSHYESEGACRIADMTEFEWIRGKMAELNLEPIQLTEEDVRRANGL